MAGAYTEVLQCIIMDRIHLAYDGNEGGWYPDMDGHRHIRFQSYSMALSHILLYHKGSNIYHKADKEASKTHTKLKKDYTNVNILFTPMSGIGYCNVRERNLYISTNDAIVCLNQRMENLKRLKNQSRKRTETTTKALNKRYQEEKERNEKM